MVLWRPRDALKCDPYLMQAQIRTHLCSLPFINLVLLRIVPQLLCDLHPANATLSIIRHYLSGHCRSFLHIALISARACCPHLA